MSSFEDYKRKDLVMIARTLDQLLKQEKERNDELRAELTKTKRDLVNSHQAFSALMQSSSIRIRELEKRLAIALEERLESY